MRDASDIGATEAATHCATGATALRLAQALRADEVDAAIERGLMTFSPCVDCDRDVATAEAQGAVLAAQHRLRTAWDARDRYRARATRLQRRERERAERRTSTAAAAPQATAPATSRPPLPAAVASALARAKAKAAGS